MREVEHGARLLVLPGATLDESDDAELARALIARDPRAPRALWRRFAPMVFRMLRRALGPGHDVEDLAQEVFLRVHRGLPYFRGEAKLSTWMYRIVANVCVQEREPGRSVSLDDERTTVRPASTDRRFGDLELRDRLEKAIARLPANYRLIVASHYLDGVQYEELAEALNMPLGTLKTQLFRAKQQLRRLLETELR